METNIFFGGMIMWWEKLYPVCLAFGLTFVCFLLFYMDFDFMNEVHINEAVLSAGITVGAVFAGFEAVEQGTLLQGVHKRFEKILNSEYGRLLLRYINESMISSLLFMAVSIFLLLIYSPALQSNMQYALPAWLFFLLYMLLSFYRCHTILGMMHKYAQQKNR